MGGFIVAASKPENILATRERVVVIFRKPARILVFQANPHASISVLKSLAALITTMQSASAKTKHHHRADHDQRTGDLHRRDRLTEQ